MLVLWGDAPNGLLLAWMGAIWLLAVARLISYRRLHHSPPGDDALLRRRRRTPLSAFAFGALYGGGAALFIACCTPYQVLFLGVLISGVLGSAATSQVNDISLRSK